MDKTEQKLFEAVSKDWTEADWEQTPPDTLRYHIHEWVVNGGDMSNLALAKFEFEQSMGW